MKKLLAFGIAIALVVAALLGCSRAAPLSLTDRVEEAFANTARAYFSAGVQSALMAKTLHPDIMGKEATDESYRVWLSRSTNDPYIKAP